MVNRVLIFLLLFICSLAVIAGRGSARATKLSDELALKDSLSGRQCYLFAYFTGKNNNRNGLHFAWSTDGCKWTAIGPEHSFLKSDYGSWSTEKKMRDPFIMQGPDGIYHCLWTINWDANVIGHASTTDFIHWSRQDYPEVMKGTEVRNCWAPEMIWDEENNEYLIFWASTTGENGIWKTETGRKYDHRMYCCTTKDFKTYSPARLFFDPGHNVIDATIRKAGRRYYMIYKDERELPVPQKNLLVAVSDHAAGPYRRVSENPFTKDWVEGPAVLQLPDSRFLVLMEAYRDHHYEARQTLDFIRFEDVTDRISVPEGAKHGSVIPVPGEVILNLMAEQQKSAQVERENSGKDGIKAPKPVYRDPVYDGAADPVVIWNPQVKKWWMFYTNRRATQTGLPGVSWVFGTQIGIAESDDGANWHYAGTASFPDLPGDCGGGNATLWAPGVVSEDGRRWHMYLSIQPGIDVKWGLPGFMAHLTSANLRDWYYVGRLGQLGTRVIDADILQMPDKTWRMYYKDQNNYSHISMTESKNLYLWSDPKEVMRISGEGPVAFQWKGYYWLLIDSWKGQVVYRSSDGNSWEKQPGDPLLRDGEGTGTDDIPNALHASVVISNNRAYMYYFTHPGRVGEDKKKDTFEQRRSSIQVVELELTRESWISANRNQPTYVRLFPPEPVRASLTVHTSDTKEISDHLFGAFFEDINYAADGGLYAELIQNRSFEYSPYDTAGRDTLWNARKGWQLVSPDNYGGIFSIDTQIPLNRNNPNYAVISAGKKGGVSLVNEGFDGIVLKAGERYNFSVFARSLSGRRGNLTIRLTGKNGEEYAHATIGPVTGQWIKYTSELVSGGDAKDARLEVIVERKEKIALDMISLFPQKTFKERKNGLRADLAQAIADLKPRFVRFPGGCLVHGDGLENMYRWKNTVGPLEQRKAGRNIWNYHQTAGLGYFEYFQFCEDIGAEPLPVVPAAVSCQNSRNGGQQGIPLSEMDDYVQEILDLIEFANGDSTTKWGRIRAEEGHPLPFHLKYLGIGNEERISDIFEERFSLIYKAVREKHPEIAIIGTAGPFCEGTDYEEGWAIADKLHIPVMDEHYYQLPGWFINHQDFYDRYPRNRSKVYLGEYASRGNTLINALAEAAYMTSLERNGDIVMMASYAPLLAKEGHTQWNPDLIYFNNSEVKPTVNYYVQQLFGQNAGDEYLTHEITIDSGDKAVRDRVASSLVRESKSGDLILKLVNILTTQVKTQISLDGTTNFQTKALKTVLTGKPDNKNLVPVTSEILVDRVFSYEMPAFSMTVIRIKTH